MAKTTKNFISMILQFVNSLSIRCLSDSCKIEGPDRTTPSAHAPSRNAPERMQSPLEMLQRA